MAEIFNVDHETGDLSQYDSTVTDGGDLSVETAAQIIEEYGLQCVIDDTTSIYGRTNFTQLTSTAFRYRIYLDPNGLTMAVGDLFRVVEIRQDNAARSYITMGIDGSDYRVIAFVVEDDASHDSTAYYTITDAPHFLEVLVQRATSDVAVDGSLSLYIDGVLQETVSSLDIFDISQPDNGRLGATDGVDAGTSGTLYLDDFILRDDDNEIGGVILGPLVGGKLVRGGGLMGGRLVR